MKITKPVGAIADLKELEYISALHQTGKNLRTDGSIRADDVAKFLMSRYGIKVTDDEVTETIAKGFGGGGLSEEDGDTIDVRAHCFSYRTGYALFIHGFIHSQFFSFHTPSSPSNSLLK